MERWAFEWGREWKNGWIDEQISEWIVDECIKLKKIDDILMNWRVNSHEFTNKRVNWWKSDECSKWMSNKLMKRWVKNEWIN